MSVSPEQKAVAWLQGLATSPGCGEWSIHARVALNLIRALSARLSKAPTILEEEEEEDLATPPAPKPRSVSTVHISEPIDAKRTSETRGQLEHTMSALLERLEYEAEERGRAKGALGQYSKIREPRKP